MRASTARFDVAVVGVSTGGVELLSLVLPQLPARFPVPLVICLHAAAGTTASLADMLDKRAAITVAEMQDKLPLRAGTAYLAPGGYHSYLESDGSCSLSVDPPVRYARPSIDVLFESAALAFGKRTLAIILSGANEDGADGVRRVKAAGGTVVIQEPATAVAPEMPRAALAAVTPDHTVAPPELAATLVRLCSRRKVQR